MVSCRRPPPQARSRDADADSDSAAHPAAHREAGGAALAAAEAAMLAGAGPRGEPVRSQRVELAGEPAQSVSYVVVGGDGGVGAKPACVLVHGFGGGVGSWAANYAALAGAGFVVYGVDLAGFGRSARPAFDAGGAAAAEDYFVRPIERWRQALVAAGHRALECPVCWVGHSLGGYVVSCYALRFPSRVERLVLVDPWGMQAATADDEARVPRVLRSLVSALPSPLSPIRWLDRAGGLGRTALRRAKHAELTRWQRACQDAQRLAAARPHADAADAPHREAEEAAKELAAHGAPVGAALPGAPDAAGAERSLPCSAAGAGAGPPTQASHCVCVRARARACVRERDKNCPCMRIYLHTLYIYIHIYVYIYLHTLCI